MSMIKFPNWAIDVITSQIPHIFGGNLGDEHKYHLANCGLISMRKNFGGMGVPNLRCFNLAMLAAWNKIFFDDRNGDWKKNLCFKYFTDKPNILWSTAGVGSPFWESIS